MYRAIPLIFSDEILVYFGLLLVNISLLTWKIRCMLISCTRQSWLSSNLMVCFALLVAILWPATALSVEDQPFANNIYLLIGQFLIVNRYHRSKPMTKLTNNMRLLYHRLNFCCTSHSIEIREIPNFAQEVLYYYSHVPNISLLAPLFTSQLPPSMLYDLLSYRLAYCRHSTDCLEC